MGIFLEIVGFERLAEVLKDAAARLARSVERRTQWRGSTHAVAMIACFDDDVSRYNVAMQESGSAPAKMYAAYARALMSGCRSILPGLSASDDPRDRHDAQLIRDIDQLLIELLGAPETREMTPQGEVRNVAKAVDAARPGELSLAQLNRRKLH